MIIRLSCFAQKVEGGAWSHGAKEYGLHNDGRSGPIWSGGKRRGLDSQNDQLGRNSSHQW